jgi:hypothetical protein
MYSSIHNIGFFGIVQKLGSNFQGLDSYYNFSILNHLKQQARIQKVVNLKKRTLQELFHNLCATCTTAIFGEGSRVDINT